MQPFDCYKMYVAMKSHFESNSYDFFKYNGKVNATFDSFCARRDKYQFSKLSRKDDVQGYILANMIERQKIEWVGDLLTEQAEQNFKQWQKRQQNLTYLIKEDLGRIEDLREAVKVEDGQHPELLKMYMQKKITIETLIIIDSYTNIFEYWQKKITDPVIWPQQLAVLEKYKPFFKFDRQKFKQILKERFIR